MRHEELQQHLRPVPAVDLTGLGRQGMPLELSDELSPAKRTIDDDADSPLPRERQEPILGFALEEVVGELDEVERLGAHEALHLVVAAPAPGPAPPAAQPARRPPGGEGPPAPPRG